MAAGAEGSSGTLAAFSRSTTAFLQARDFLLTNRSDYGVAYEGFQWPELEQFNWAFDYFDAIAAGNTRPALIVTSQNSTDQTVSFADMRERSNQVANFFVRLGISRGDRILVMLGNEIALWETMLAALKIGAVLVPTSTLVGTDEIKDRIERGRVRHVISSLDGCNKFELHTWKGTLLSIGGAAKGWTNFDESYSEPKHFAPSYSTNGSDPLLLYFTSGTTARPKLVLHSQHSYPVGHLSTMYWIGIQPGDLHWNISSPGWAKHAWSSFFAPWNAGACILASQDARFRAGSALDILVRTGVTTLCAPPTVWRMLIKADLRKYKVKLREAVSAGEPLNPEVVRQVEDCWGLTIRDGYGQTETTALVGNTPGQKLKPGSMGRPLPGYRIRALDISGEISNEGQLCVDRRNVPLGLMLGYESQERGDVESGDHHLTGDIGSIDDEGYVFFVGRADDVFKSSDYRISPFELESIVIEHPAVLESAVIPSPDPVRFVVPKAFVSLAPGYPPDENTARDIFSFLRQKLARYQRIRRLEFAELPKTSSGKIRRSELKQAEQERSPEMAHRPFEYFDQDFE
ncbi:MAG: AMP-binding protein [Acidobacteriaceae bacterium]|nr:AMP-binding protein [Acidobacteriaceae bacterium]